MVHGGGPGSSGMFMPFSGAGLIYLFNQACFCVDYAPIRL